MPSGAKRRKAAKKKKKENDKKTAAAVILRLNENGEVQQNSFTENKERSFSTESIENDKLLNGENDDVKIVVDGMSNGSVKGGVNHGGLSKSTNRSLSRENVHYNDGDDGSQVVAMEARNEEKEDSKEVTDDPEESFDMIAAATHVKVAASNVSLDKVVVIHEPERMPPVQTSVGCSAVAELKHEDKVHPPISNTNSVQQSSIESSIKQMPESNILIGNHDWPAESSDIQQCPEKEALLPPADGPVNKTSVLGCCGFLELFTSSSR